MVFEIPEGVNVYDLIALAVIEQAVQDTASDQAALADEAWRWLAEEGHHWWDVLGLGDDLYSRLVGEQAARFTE